MASHHFIVLVDQMCWRVLHVSGQRVLAMRVLDGDDSSRTALSGWWGQFPSATVSFLINHVDEHYHVETLPKVGGAAGSQLLTRKLAAWPFSQGMHAVCHLDDVQALRPERRFLFVAFAYQPLVDWLRALQEQSVRVQGVYTQALGLASWLPQALQGIKHRLCIQYLPQQVRISYLQQKLFFSRLVLLPSETFTSSEAGVGRVLHEINQIRMTLMHQQWVQDADALSLIWLGPMTVEAQLLKAQLPTSFVWVELPAAEMTRHEGAQPLPEGLHATEWATVKLILNGQSLPNLAPEPVLLLEISARIKRRLHRVGAVMMAAMVMAGYVGMRAIEHDQMQLLAIERQLKVGQLNPGLVISQAQLAGLRDVMKAVQGLQSSVRLPDHALAIMQNVLMGMTHWRVTALEWRMLSGDSSHDVDTQYAGLYSAILTVTWSQGDQSDQAALEWQQLLARLRELAAVAKVEVLNASASNGNARHLGNTGLAPAPERPPVLKLYLRDAKPVTT